jgi:hypothetical protein
MSWSAKTGIARRTVYTTGTAATHTYLPNIRSAIIWGVAGGGGSGGVSASTTGAAAGGGAAGGYFTVLSTTGLTTCTYTIGTGGLGGTSGPTDGGTGNDTIVVHDSVTYTAKGGLGGKLMTGGSAVAVAAGGANVSTVGGDMSNPGNPGMPGIRLSATQVASGVGGSSIFGPGGKSQVATGAGFGGGTGGGAGGACSTTSSQIGGPGGNGIVIIEEYY